MKILWRYILITAAMLLGLYLYFMYHSQDTIVNVLLAKLGVREFPFLMNIWHKHYAIPQWCMYSLPEGLWVFSATLLSIRLQFPIWGKRIQLQYLPFLFAILVELIQVLGITNGQFDCMYIFFSFIFSGLALLIPSKEQKKNAIESREFWLLVLIYALVYLSDV